MSAGVPLASVKSEMSGAVFFGSYAPPRGQGEPSA